ncbi:hypothetical protein GA0116948_104258 [Chitinophaga costaii]|uniref:Uncharacterized protein n=1 Tax=Chitinophaga costaii TaxID=1335309 RepID=A0A1C4CRR0_9BACT|nr:hypothetical protein DCM91_07020 [Chitinophaga costaii]SCC21671.1 hypothetical protein GA0116948_104258 [Chitinophaga costaii]
MGVFIFQRQGRVAVLPMFYRKLPVAAKAYPGICAIFTTGQAGASPYVPILSVPCSYLGIVGIAPDLQAYMVVMSNKMLTMEAARSGCIRKKLPVGLESNGYEYSLPLKQNFNSVINNIVQNN